MEVVDIWAKVVAPIMCAVIAAAATILVAVLETRASKDRKRAEIRAKRRAKESRLSMELMSATCELSVVTAVAYKEGHMNGTLEPALQKAEKAQEDYQSFLRDEAAYAVSKL